VTAQLAWKRVATSVLVLGALAGAALAFTAPAQAADIAWSVPVAESAASYPDVGSPAEAAANAGTPAVAPDGSLAWPTSTPAQIRPSSSATARSWIVVTAIADGARIRAHPVNGPVSGAIARGGSSGSPANAELPMGTRGLGLPRRYLRLGPR
jgi:hypothetical protein